MTARADSPASERIGADRYERTETRVSDRNGSRPRLLATQGDVQLRIPKLRKGSLFPVILEPRRRIDDQALFAAFAIRWWSPRGSHSASPKPRPVKGVTPVPN